MANYRKRFIVEPRTEVKLSDFDPGDHNGLKSHKAAQADIEENLGKLDKLQYLMYAEKKHSLLIVLQGLDGAGKDGVVRHLFSGVDPAGCTVTGFKQPTPADLAHDFLWRVHPHVPAKGTIAVFNRSHYEDVLIARVHDLVPKKKWEKRYELINEFERLLVVDNDTAILKFFLHISEDEQLDRFRKRLEDPNRQWKISEADYEERAYWDDYTKAYEEVLHKTSTKHAPWFVIPSNHKWFRNLAISQILTTRLEDLKMKPPKPTVDIEEIRRKYHEAKKAQQKD